MDDVMLPFRSKCYVDENGCWRWQAALTHDGYARLMVHGKARTMHRWSYEQFVGPIPYGLALDHLCRVRDCVNPKHLEAVTVAENNRRIPLHLRGASNRTKTHCKRGHPFDDANTIHRIVNGRPARACRACQPIFKEAWRQRRSA